MFRQTGRKLIWKKEFETERRFWIICGLN
jgi:hypothetical protein